MVDFKSYDWSDLGNLDQYDYPILVPLAQIAYSADYKLATTLVHAVMQKKEISKRALDLTAAVIEMNPAHYTLWDYRLTILKKIGSDPEVILPTRRLVKSIGENNDVIIEDGPWLDEITLNTPKNYQCWNYRQYLEIIGNEDYYRGELLIVKYVLEDDSKNFHAWSHLKWVTSRLIEFLPQFFKESNFLKLSEQFIAQDVRNNSAWNYRFFLNSTDSVRATALRASSSPEFQQELEFVKSHINIAPQNESAWNYLRGLYATFRDGEAKLELEEFCLQHIPTETPIDDDSAVLEDVKSIFAVELLADIYKLKGRPELSAKCVGLLTKVNPEREPLWRAIA